MTETVEAGQYEESVNTDTLVTERTLLTESYSGIGQIKYPSLTVSERNAGGQQVAATSPVLKIPTDSGLDIREGHLVRVTASTIDGSLVGREFRVAAWPQSGQVTAHRYPLEELS